MVYHAPESLDGRVHAILGAGTLGRRVALMWLTQGETVHLIDSNPAQLESAKAYIDATLPSVLSDVVPSGKAGTLQLFTDRAQGLASAWLVTEAVPEIQQLKIDLLGELDEQLAEDVIIASNSSSFKGSEIFGKMRLHRDRLVNTHYYMPPRVLPVEIMGHAETSKEIAPLLTRESKRHGLIPYNVHKESIGLIANRIWAAIKRESLYVVAEGVSTPAEVDSLLMNVYGMAAGPFVSMDGVGLDVVRDIESHYRAVRTGLPDEVMTLLESMISQGKLGNKSGEGFYKHPTTKPHAADHLIYLDIVKGAVCSMTTDGKEQKQLVSGLLTMPDGVQISADGTIYFTNMGRSPRAADGSIQRIKPSADRSTAMTEPDLIVPAGATHTPKQIQLVGDTLYWADREGGRLQRCHVDGSALQTLYDAAPGAARPLTDAHAWCVGIAVDAQRGHVYWTQKGQSKGWQGRIFRANLEIPQGQTAENRSDVETLYDHLPEPIDLEIDEQHARLFWTDRGDPPFGNSLNAADVSAPLDPNRAPQGPSAKLVIAERFHEAIGLALDTKGKKIYVSDLLGSVWSTEYDGSNKTAIVRDQGNFTGLAFSPAP